MGDRYGWSTARSILLNWTPARRFIDTDGRRVSSRTRSGNIACGMPGRRGLVPGECADEVVLAALPAGRSEPCPVGRSLPGLAAGGDGPAYSAVLVTDHLSGHTWRVKPVPWSFYEGGPVQPRRESEYYVAPIDAILHELRRRLGRRTGRRLAASTANTTAPIGMNISDVITEPTGRRRSKSLTVVEVATGRARPFSAPRQGVLGSLHPGQHEGRASSRP